MGTMAQRAQEARRSRTHLINVSGMDGLPSDIMFGEFGQLDAIADFARETAVRVAKEVAQNNSKNLGNFGQKITANAVHTVLKDIFPKYILDYVQPHYVEGPPPPKWVSDITGALTAPIVTGAQKEALAISKRVRLPIIMVVGGIVLTIFGVGYILGNAVGRNRAFEKSSNG